MVTTLCIVLVYSTYSPLMLVCGAFYILLKHYVDRFSICKLLTKFTNQLVYIYGHKAELDAMQNKSSAASSTLFKSDYNTHSRRIQLLSKLFVFNFIVYFGFQV